MAGLKRRVEQLAVPVKAAKGEKAALPQSEARVETEVLALLLAPEAPMRAQAVPRLSIVARRVTEHRAVKGMTPRCASTAGVP